MSGEVPGPVEQEAVEQEVVNLEAVVQEAARLEASGRHADALALCERMLTEHHFDAADSVAVQAEAQFNQRRLRLRRKLGLPTWSSQGAPF